MRRTEGPLKHADSKTTVVVSPVISLFAPPITPATATGFSASAMTRFSGVSACRVPSSVVIDSPAAARRTRISWPARQRQSNECIGWPYSSIT